MVCSKAKVPNCQDDVNRTSGWMGAAACSTKSEGFPLAMAYVSRIKKTILSVLGCAELLAGLAAVLAGILTLTYAIGVPPNRKVEPLTVFLSSSTETASSSNSVIFGGVGLAILISGIVMMIYGSKALSTMQIQNFPSPSDDENDL